MTWPPVYQDRNEQQNMETNSQLFKVTWTKGNYHTPGLFWQFIESQWAWPAAIFICFLGFLLLWLLH